MIASMMMYQRPQLEEAHDRYWQLIRQNLKSAGVEGPERLCQDAEEFHVWKHPGLVLSQTCGMPYRTWLHDKVQLVGTPDYGLTGCPPAHYRSALVVRADDDRDDLGSFRDAIFAYNQTFSQSGYAAPFWLMKPLGCWFENRLHTGQHLESAKAVADGRADIASLDAVSWRLMVEYEPFAPELRVLEWTMPTPGLPLITSNNQDSDILFDSVKKAIGQLRDDDRRSLGLCGIVRISKQDYLAVPNPDQPGPMV